MIWTRWKDRGEASWKRYLGESGQETEFVAQDEQRATVRYQSREVVDNMLGRPTGRAVCAVTLDVDYARAYEAWYATPGARASRRRPAEIDPWSRMDCRRTSGWRAWLGGGRR